MPWPLHLRYYYPCPLDYSQIHICLPWWRGHISLKFLHPYCYLEELPDGSCIAMMGKIMEREYRILNDFGLNAEMLYGKTLRRK